MLARLLGRVLAGLALVALVAWPEKYGQVVQSHYAPRGAPRVLALARAKKLQHGNDRRHKLVLRIAGTPEWEVYELVRRDSSLSVILGKYQ